MISETLATLLQGGEWECAISSSYWFSWYLCVQKYKQYWAAS